MPQKIPFRVIHASSHDDNYQVHELNTHSPLTRGWQSAKYCAYPQDIVIQLDERSQTKKIQILSHQSLIATRVEFFIGDVPPEQAIDVSNARFTRLGYVALSDNEQTGFKARELKSVHVSAVGIFLKLVIHKNHINQYNPFNQVGIIAINVIGDRLSNGQEPAAPVTEGTDADADSKDRPGGEYISPLDDLAFDMYQDAEVAQIIRKLEKKKQEAVMQERYDYAKRLKQGIVELQKVGERLGKYEVEKRQAVEAEDYDKAKLKKVQMEEYRLKMYKELYVHDLLELSGPSRYQAPEVPQHSLENNDPFIISPRQPPAEQQPAAAAGNGGGVTSRPAVAQSYDDKPLPSLANRKNPLSPDPADAAQLQESVAPQDVDSGPESTPRGVNDGGPDASAVEGPAELTEAEMRQASAAIEVFGLPLVQKAYSKSWHLKTESITEMTQAMTGFQGEKEDARNMFRAAVMLVAKHLKDKVHSIFKAAIDAQQFMVTTFAKQQRLPKSDIGHCIEKTLPEILYRCADTAAGTRNDAKACVMSFCDGDRQYLQFVLPIVVKPFKLSIPARNGQSRVEIVKEVYNKHKLDDGNGFSIETLMAFLTNGLNHTGGSVRSASELLIIDLYKEYRAPVKTHLPPDDERTRKNILYRQLFEALDKLDGKPSRRDVEKQRAEEEAAKAAEVEALQHQINQLKALNNAHGGKGRAAAPAAKDKPPAAAAATASTSKQNGKAAAQHPAAPAAAARAGAAAAATDKDQTKKKAADASKSGASMATPAPGKSVSKNSISVDDDAISSITKFDRTCIFCNEHNEDFTEEGLDMHYWKSCPMLKRCTHCKQVVEVSGLTEHLLTECEAKGNYSRCHRCTEAVLTPELDDHLKSPNCNPNEIQKIHCPLCHQNIPQSENDWMDHLMGDDGCKQNPRRVAALSRQGQAKQTAASKPKQGAAAAASPPQAAGHGGTQTRNNHPAPAGGAKGQQPAPLAGTAAAKQR